MDAHTQAFTNSQIPIVPADQPWEGPPGQCWKWFREGRKRRKNQTASQPKLQFTSGLKLIFYNHSTLLKNNFHEEERVPLAMFLALRVHTGALCSLASSLVQLTFPEPLLWNSQARLQPVGTEQQSGQKHPPCWRTLVN